MKTLIIYTSQTGFTKRYAEDVSMIEIAGQDQEDNADGMVDGIMGGFFGKLKDAQVINAAEYKM